MKTRTEASQQLGPKRTRAHRNHPCWWSETIPFSLFTQSHRTGACFRDLEMSGGSCLISPQPTKQNIPSFTLNPGNSPSLSLTSSPPFAGNIPPSAELLTWDPSQPVEPPPRAQNRVRRVWFWRGGEVTHHDGGVPLGVLSETAPKGDPQKKNNH